MIKILSLIVGGIFLMAMGGYALSVSNFQFPNLVWPQVDWAVVGFVALVGGLISTGTGIAVSRLA